MSYCRWSSDDYKCSVYCYESDVGFEVWVAFYRHDPLPPHCPSSLEVAEGRISEDEWRKAYDEQMQSLKASQMIPIGLSCDGENYVFPTASECADCLQNLKAEGYYVPQYAIDELLEEAARLPEEAPEP
jgi:hypothetical protein